MSTDKTQSTDTGNTDTTGTLDDKLRDVLSVLDVPEARKELNLDNVQWMIRNIGIRNSLHPRCEEAKDLLKEKAKELFDFTYPQG